MVSMSLRGCYICYMLKSKMQRAPRTEKWQVIDANKTRAIIETVWTAVPRLALCASARSSFKAIKTHCERQGTRAFEVLNVYIVGVCVLTHNLCISHCGLIHTELAYTWWKGSRTDMNRSHMLVLAWKHIKKTFKKTYWIAWKDD